MSTHDDNDTQTPTPTSEGTMPSTEMSATPRAWLKFRVPIAMAAIASVVFLVDVALTSHHDNETNHVALSAEPKGVTVVDGVATTYRPTRRYVGQVEPWLSARVGPQFTSAYVGTVLVRPGDSVKKGQVVATLDCRNASAQSSAVQMRAKAVSTEQEAMAHRAARMSNLVEGGFVSSDELEKQQADSESKAAELLAAQAQLEKATLEVDDCILRAPFDGEVSDRFMDPGSFARPGMPVVTVVDRHTVRVTADVPESDFDAVAPKTEVAMHLLATGRDVKAIIARRAPSADGATRTVHVEIDIDGADRSIPVGTTAEIAVEVGEAKPAISVPLAAASIKGDNATIYVVDGDAQPRAHKKVVHLLGERAGTAFLDASIAPAGTTPTVVLEGRSLLEDNDVVSAKHEGTALAATTGAVTTGNAADANDAVKP